MQTPRFYEGSRDLEFFTSNPKSGCLLQITSTTKSRAALAYASLGMFLTRRSTFMIQIEACLEPRRKTLGSICSPNNFQLALSHWFWKAFDAFRTKEIILPNPTVRNNPVTR